jgi:hypothetical protein
LVLAFLKKWLVESDFKAPILPLSFTAQSFRLSLLHRNARQLTFLVWYRHFSETWLRYVGHICPNLPTYWDGVDMQVSNVHMWAHSTTKQLKFLYGNRFSLMFKRGLHIFDVLRINSYAPIYALSSTYLTCNTMSIYIKWKAKMPHMYHKEQRIITLVI